ncbi:MAG: hypothetical protein JSU00_12245 [Acidobacteria bacterium]|nr:hypothetical protein [Acidobacteriota bacterium]
MPYQLVPDTQVRYALIAFDKDGVERADDPDGINGRLSDRILAEAAAEPPTNVFFFSHGWLGDMPGAVAQYNSWIGAMLDLGHDIARMGPEFRPLWIGLHWPSLAWGDEDLGGASFDAVGGDLSGLKQTYLNELGGTEEVRAALDVIFKENEQNAAAMVMPPRVVDAYNRLAAAIGFTGEGPGAAPEAEGKPFDPVEAFEAAGDSDFAPGAIVSALLWPLRRLSFWTMKARARTIGERGMHDFIARLQNALPHTTFHLMGHSFGCVVVSSILGGVEGRSPLPRPLDSVVLAQGALSLWAYADRVGSSSRQGYFNAALREPAVRGPVVTTRSKFDSAVGSLYPKAVALVRANPDFGADDPLTPPSLPVFGGIGTYGIRGYAGVRDLEMLRSDGEYPFKGGQIYNLRGDAFIPDHNGITGPEVAHVIWQAAQAGVANAAAGGRR